MVGPSNLQQIEVVRMFPKHNSFSAWVVSVVVNTLYQDGFILDFNGRR